MPIAIRDKRPQPISKKEAFKKYKKREGHHHKADPNHPMNAERTGPPRREPPKRKKPNPEKRDKKPEKKKPPQRQKTRRYAKRY